MSVFLTQQAVRDEIKTVTRRAPNTWQTLNPGDPLALIEKGQGLKKGEKQNVLKVVTVVSNRVEPLVNVCRPAEWRAELTAEGFNPDQWFRYDWAAWWAVAHGHRELRQHQNTADVAAMICALRPIQCRRIEWRYTP
jgi:hypothetical protein